MTRAFKQHIVTISIVTMALLSPIAYAGLPPVPPQPLFEALQKGDPVIVHRLEDELKAGPNTRAMDDAQLKHDLPRLLQEAQHCEQVDLDKGTQGGLLGALRCNTIARSSALSLGDGKAFLAEALWARKELLPQLTKAFGASATFGNGLDSADLAGLVVTTPSPTTSWGTVAKSLPFQKVSDLPLTRAAPQPSFKINGHSATLSVATNRSPTTPLWFTVSPGEKDGPDKAFGLSLLVRNVQAATVAFRGRSYPIQVDLYLAHSIEFGPLTLENIVVVVVTTDYLPPGIDAGIPLLGRFGEVVMDDEKMLLSRQMRDACPGGAPMAFASGPALDGSEVFPISIGGKAARAAFDSGSGGSIEVSPRANNSIVNGASIELGIGSWTSKMRASVPPDWQQQQDAVIGNTVLKGNTVRLRFDPQSPSICLLSHVST